MDSVTKIIITESGESIIFPRITIHDLLEIGNVLTAENEVIARKLASEEKPPLSRYEVYNLVLGIRQNKVTFAQILANCDTPDGAIRILKKSMAKAEFTPEKQVEVLKGNIPELIDLARCLVLDVQVKVDEQPVPAVSAEVEESSPLQVGGEPRAGLSEAPTISQPPAAPSTGSVLGTGRPKPKKTKEEILKDVAVYGHS